MICENKKRVLCAMSGGVDSSVAARLLLEEGYEVIGVTMVLLRNNQVKENAEEDELLKAYPEANDARQIARDLGIEHVVIDYRRVFNDRVVVPFCNSYVCGLTPNPCIECNKYLKFGALHTLRKELSCDYLATGHYAQVLYNAGSGKYELHRGFDPKKDQSYVLYHVSQEDLAHTLFPLGSLSKEQTRMFAQQAHLKVAQKAESQDICFIPDGDYAEFIESYLNCFDQSDLIKPGPIVDTQGNVLGKHNGLTHYTIGQRKGLGVAVGEPLFVLSKDSTTNTLFVGRAAETGVSQLRANDVFFPSDDDLFYESFAKVKVNYRAKLRDAKVHMQGEELVVDFTESISAVAPGQAVVLYIDDRVIAGGTITSFT